MTAPMDDPLGTDLDALNYDIEQRIYQAADITLADALFLLGGAAFVATGLRGERDYERGLRRGLDRYARTLGEERDAARAERDLLCGAARAYLAATALRSGIDNPRAAFTRRQLAGLVGMEP